MKLHPVRIVTDIECYRSENSLTNFLLEKIINKTILFFIKTVKLIKGSKTHWSFEFKGLKVI